MTTSTFIPETVDQELTLDSMKSINGGVAPVYMAFGFALGLVTDQALEHTTGKGLSEHFEDAVNGAVETLADGVDALVNGTDQTGDTDVVTTGS